MTPFHVDPIDLISLARTIERSEQFSALADAARRVAIPESPGASSLAIERFADRLVGELTTLAAATGSLASATRSAAGSYQQVEDSITSMSSS